MKKNSASEDAATENAPKPPAQDAPASDAPALNEAAPPDPAAETASAPPAETAPNNIEIIVKEEQPAYASPLEHLTAVAYNRFRIGQGDANAFPAWINLNDSEKGLLSKGALHVFTGGEARTDFERAVASIVG